MMSYYSFMYCVILLVSLRVHGNLLETLRKLDRNQLPHRNVTHNVSQGFLMCAGNHMIGEVVQMIWQIRYHWRSELGIAVAHCGEINEENHASIYALDPTVKMLNICDTNPTLGMPIEQARSRLRGFFCKVGAMILSPFRETMLVDLDVVWFKPPDLLFQSSLYTSTGALFFRDRVYPSDENRKNDYKLLRELFEKRGVVVNATSATALARAHGVSFFWRYIASTFTEEPEVHQVSDIQDSSIVLIDRARNAAMLGVLRELLPSFDIGYGDKEIFWVAATLAGENFVFEPFLAAQYADCYGVILHYDPDDAAGSPLYVNAEYIVERDISLVGQFLSPAMTPPILVTADMVLVPSMDTWPGGKGRGDRGCTCRSFPCLTVPAHATAHLLYAQWITLSKRVTRPSAGVGTELGCVEVQGEYAGALQHVFAAEVPPEHCVVMGCPQLPIALDPTLPWPEERRYCDPVHFDRTAPADLLELAQAARHPDSAYNKPSLPDGTPVQCDFDRQLYWYKNGSLHPFGDWNAFVSKGLDLADVVRLPRRKFERFSRSAEPVY